MDRRGAEAGAQPTRPTRTGLSRPARPEVPETSEDRETCCAAIRGRNPDKRAPALGIGSAETQWRMFPDRSLRWAVELPFATNPASAAAARRPEHLQAPSASALGVW